MTDLRAAISKEDVEALLHYKKEDGTFVWKSRHGSRKANSHAGYLEDGGYLVIKIHGRQYKAHRLAWLLEYGTFPLNSIDHVNGNKVDNRICNLKDVSHSTNILNQSKPRIDNKSGFLGVSPNGSGWRAELKVGGKKRNFGTYPTPEQAHAAYMAAKRKHQEGCTI
jgi:hypothetical protein